MHFKRSPDSHRGLGVSGLPTAWGLGFEKKMHASRRFNAEDLDVPTVDGEDQTPVDDGPILPRPRSLYANFVDGNELQAALVHSRRAKPKKPKKLLPKEIAGRGTQSPLILPFLGTDDNIRLLAEQRARPGRKAPS